MSELEEEQTLVVRAQEQRQGASEACLVTVAGNDICRRWDLSAERVTLGRAEECDIQVDVQGVSRVHATLRRSAVGIFIEDMRSTNGTLVNGKPITEKRLVDGDQIQLGKATFKFLERDNIESAYYDELYRLTTTDDLTQVHNRRYFFTSLEQEIARAQRHRRDLSLVMFDIDHFKRLNDTYGHPAGDVVLHDVAQRVQALCRHEDVLARYGGEEFALLLPEVAKTRAAGVAQRMCAAIAEAPFIYQGQEIYTSISLGVSDLRELAQLPGALEQPTNQLVQHLIRLADNKLYAAKQSGRNRVVA